MPKAVAVLIGLSDTAPARRESWARGRTRAQAISAATITDRQRERVISRTLREHPAGSTHSSTRAMARVDEPSQPAVSRIWLRRLTHRPVVRLNAGIRSWIAHSNEHPQLDA